MVIWLKDIPSMTEHNSKERYTQQVQHKNNEGRHYNTKSRDR